MLAEKIIKSVANPIVYEKNNLEVGISIGVSFTSHSCQDSETLISNADKALYQSKKLGRNRFTIYSQD